MFKKHKVALGEFTKLGPAKLVVYGRNNVSMLTGNANFTNLPKPLEVVTADIDDLDTKTAAALSRDMMAIAERDAAQAVVVDDLRGYVGAVQTQSNGNLAKILSSGFQPTKTPARIGILTSPLDLRAFYTGATGELGLRFKKVRGASSYIAQTATTADGPRITHPPSTSTRMTLKGFTPGTVYFIWVAAVGAAGMSGYSGPVMIMAV